MSYERILIDGEPHLKGTPPLENVHCLGLNVGDRVTQVGFPGKSGKQTSSARVDKFTQWVEYAGWYKIDLIIYLAFRIPPGAVLDRDDIEVTGDFYKLYILFKAGSLCVPNHYNLTSRFYSGEFVMYQEEAIA